MNIKYVIPSRERASWLLKRKWNALMFVDGELIINNNDNQIEYYKKLTNKFNATLKLIPPPKSGVSQVYDYLINESIKENYDVLIIIDDDNFIEMENIKHETPIYKKCTKYESMALLNHAEIGRAHV